MSLERFYLGFGWCTLSRLFSNRFFVLPKQVVPVILPEIYRIFTDAEVRLFLEKCFKENYVSLDSKFGNQVSQSDHYKFPVPNVEPL